MLSMEEVGNRCKMKQIVQIITLALVVFFTTACNSQSTDQNQGTKVVTEVTVSELKTQVDQKTAITILDVRTDGEVAEGKIKDAVHINLYASDFDQKVNKLDKNKPVYVYCKVGGRSAAACKKMQKMGFSKVINVDGGIMGWKAKGYPLVK